MTILPQLWTYSVFFFLSCVKVISQLEYEMNHGPQGVIALTLFVIVFSTYFLLSAMVSVCFSFHFISKLGQCLSLSWELFPLGLGTGTRTGFKYVQCSTHLQIYHTYISVWLYALLVPILYCLFIYYLCYSFTYIYLAYFQFLNVFLFIFSLVWQKYSSLLWSSYKRYIKLWYVYSYSAQTFNVFTLL